MFTLPLAASAVNDHRSSNFPLLMTIIAAILLIAALGRLRRLTRPYGAYLWMALEGAVVLILVGAALLALLTVIVMQH